MKNYIPGKGIELLVQSPIAGLAKLAGLHKEASAAKLIRYIISLQRKGLPVSQELINTLINKTRSSADRLQSLVDNSNIGDMSNKLRQIGIQKPINYIRAINQGKGISGINSLDDSLQVQQRLHRHGQNFAKVRENIPRNYWASNAEIEAIKKHIRAVRTLEGLDPKQYPINIHRRLFSNKNDNFGGWGSSSRPADTPLLESLSNSRISAGSHVSGALDPSRSRSFLYPTDEVALSHYRKYYGIPKSMPDEHLRELGNINTLWHEAGGHGLDSRFRQGLTPLERLTNKPDRASAESLASIYGNYGMFRQSWYDQFSKNVNAIDPLNSEYMQRLANRAYQTNAQSEGAPSLSGLFKFLPTSDPHSAATKLHQQPWLPYL